MDSGFVSPLGGMSPAGGDMGTDRVFESIKHSMDKALEFQSLMTSLAESHNAFKMVATAKQEGMKHIADLTRDGIRKSSG